MSDERDPLKAASRALADAAAQLTRALGSQAKHALPEVGEVVAQGLREAARELADASDSLGRSAAAGDERRRRKVDRTRTDLLAAAARVFSAKGFEGASVDDVAADAGYTKGAVYSHFGSKRDLFLAVARAQLDEGDHVLPGVQDGRVDVDALTAWLAGVTDDPHLLLSVEILAYGLRHPEAAGDLAEVYARAFDVLTAHIAAQRVTADVGAGRGSDPEVTQHDRDTALGVVAVLNLAPLGARLLGEPHASAASGARVVARLLADPADPVDPADPT